MSRGYVQDERAGGVVVSESGGQVRVAVSASEAAAVQRAVKNLAGDLHAITGSAVAIAHGASADVGANVVVGTIGASPLIDAAVAAGILDLSGLRDEDGRLRWEGFAITAVGETVYVAGADQRGTVFGVYDLCEAIGVSPWAWWGDVPVRRRPHVTVTRGTTYCDWPGVRYRGIFLNDEEELEAWARAHLGEDTIGPATYERVLELLLRLKGNYLWPAMHVSAFNDDPANGRLAHEMGVIVGTSHCDMLLRSNEHEWRPWSARQSEDVQYDYSIPGRNRELVQEYWRGSIHQNRDYEVTWTVGMRGIHDYGFRTSVIDADEHMSDAEKDRARVALLGTVIADQRGLLASELGAPAETVPQIFIPYKEVLPLYDAGLDVPDDVTIVWANDNFGYVRRFPSGEELHRSGGHGLYYHSSYWSMPPRSYLATSSTPLALMRQELTKSWERGIRRLWVNNVGGLKPLEVETEYFLRCAWEAGKETTTGDVVGFVEQWVDKTFTGGHGKQVGPLYAAYYQLNNQRKLEHLDAGAFAQTSYGDEAGRRLAALRGLYEEANEIHASLPADEQDAFFQLIAVKIHLAYLVSGQFLHADRSTLAHQQGKAAAADRHLDRSREYEAHKRALLHFYDTTMSGGRWRHIFTPESFPPPAMALHPAARPALRIGSAPGLGVLTYDDGPLPRDRPRLRFAPYGTTSRWIEVFTTGSPTRFTIDADPWIELGVASGTVDTEQRIEVRVPELHTSAGRHGTITVTDPDSGTIIKISVDVAPVRPVDPQFVGAVESDGYVCLDPAQPDRRRPGSSSSWDDVPHLGRYGNALTVARRTGPAPDAPNSEDAVLEYDIVLATAGAHLAELHRLPTLDSTGRIRLGLSIDDMPPVVVESPTTDEYRGAWTSAVLDNVERLLVRLPYLPAGRHTLRLHAMDRDMALSKIVVYTRTRQETNLGPGFSHHTSRPQPAIADPGVTVDSDDRLIATTRTIYRTDPTRVPLPPVVYAGPGFWDGDTTFKRNLVETQGRLGKPRLWTMADGSKDVVARLGTGAIKEVDGVLALETEDALTQDERAWMTPSLDPVPVAWTHTQSETDAGTGLAMHVAERGGRWDDPTTAPGLHYALQVTRPGIYRAWLLVKFDSTDDDSCVLAIDGTPQPIDQQHSGGDLYSFGTQQIWFWTLLSDVVLTEGHHVLSILARKSGLRIDRIYLSTGDELPPADAAWTPSPRNHL
ncbi:glycosyl hydrolase 115 family protein [Promicromonospora sp. NPDC057488]|uniref:glycosyl hydrolase 115 family protein n=1 Tax=Promicromonospora sp. NPDC057488 TaxID=3346147 RepID=UPI00366C4C57